MSRALENTGTQSAARRSAIPRSDATRDSETYRLSPHHRANSVASIQFCETHISRVALVGALAYRLKKPVRYDFLDYSSLEERYAACNVELELNGRWAPDL